MTQEPSADKAPMSKQEAEKLRKERDEKNKQVQGLAAKNKEAISKMKTLFEQVKAEKIARDAANKDSQQLRVQLNELSAKAKPIREKLKPVYEKLKGAKGQNPHKMREELDALDYRLHLEGANPHREKIIAKQIREIAAKLKEAESLVPELEGFKQERKQLDELTQEMRVIYKKLKAASAAADTHHKAMQDLYKQADKLRTEFKSAFEQIDSIRADANKLHEQYMQISDADRGEKRKKFKEQREQEDLERKEQQEVEKLQREKQKEVLTGKAAIILEKFKKGETISLEELQILQAAKIDLSSLTQ